MSVRVSTWVWHDTTAKGNDLLVLLALADTANDDGTCWPGVSTIADKTRLSRRTVQRVLDRLETGDLLERTERTGYPNLYRVLVPWGVRQNDAPGGASPVTQGCVTSDAGGASRLTHRTVREPSKNRGTRATPIPDEWKPTPAHADFARKHDLDLSSEAFAFRAHAQANDRRQVRWDQSFALWLSKSRQMNRQRGPQQRSQWDRAERMGGES